MISPSRKCALGSFSEGARQPFSGDVRSIRSSLPAMARKLLLALAMSVAASCGRATEPSPTSGIDLVSSVPTSGAELVVSSSALRLTFSVRYDDPLPDAVLHVELLDASGRTCGFNFTEPRPIVPGQAATLISDFLVWECPLPAETTAVRATLVTLRNAGGGLLQRTEYLRAQFNARYRFRRYPPPPTGMSPSPPTIDALSWRVNLPTGGDPPIPGDPTSVTCRVTDADGSAATLTLTVTWEGTAPRTVSETFPAGATSSVEGASLTMTTDAGDPPRARADCAALDESGFSAFRSIAIP
jgi:hypothetical protein